MQVNVNHIHMADATAVSLGGNLFKKQLLKLGEWVHPNDPSRKLRITKEVIRRLIQNFQAGIIEKVPVPDTHTRSSKANTGYVVGLEETEDGLDAILEIRDEEAANKLRQGLIPGISASYSENYLRKDTGEQVGPVLLHAALVDNPYLKGMRDFEPVNMGDDEGAEHTPFVALEDQSTDPMEGGNKDMTKEEMIAKLKADHGIDVAALSDAAGKVEGLETQLSELTNTVSEVQKAFGDTVELSDDFTIIDGVRDLVSKVKEKETEAVQLSDRLAKLENDVLARDAKEAVNGLISEGKLAPAQAEEYEALYLSDKDLFAKIAEKMKKVHVVELGERGISHFVKPGDGAEMSPEEAQAEIERLASLV